VGLALVGGARAEKGQPDQQRPAQLLGPDQRVIEREAAEDLRRRHDDQGQGQQGQRLLDQGVAQVAGFLKGADSAHGQALAYSMVRCSRVRIVAPPAPTKDRGPRSGGVMTWAKAAWSPCRNIPRPGPEGGPGRARGATRGSGPCRALWRLRSAGNVLWTQHGGIVRQEPA